MKVPTDLKILGFIYDHYYETFAAYSKEKPTRNTKIYVPIDVDMIGKHFSVDGDIIFGSLYYHLNHKFGYTNDKGHIIRIFTTELIGQPMGKDINVVNFPYLASVLADLRRERSRYRWAIGVSVLSLIISLYALWFSKGG